MRLPNSAPTASTTVTTKQPRANARTRSDHERRYGAVPLDAIALAAVASLCLVDAAGAA